MLNFNVKDITKLLIVFSQSFKMRDKPEFFVFLKISKTTFFIYAKSSISNISESCMRSFQFLIELSVVFMFTLQTHLLALREKKIDTETMKIWKNASQ